MSLMVDIRNALIANTPLVNVVSDKIYVGIVDQNTEAPYIRFFNVSTVPYNSLPVQDTLERVRIQFDCYAESYAEVDNLYKLLKNAILSSGLKAHLVNKFDRFEDGVELNTITCDYYFWE